jgi:ketol-acid reductoisomerase
MKVKELNKKIFHNSSQLSREDYLQMLSFCYERNVGSGLQREQAMDTCMQKWKAIYNYMDSEELMDSYTAFYRQIKKQPS